MNEVFLCRLEISNEFNREYSLTNTQISHQTILKSMTKSIDPGSFSLEIALECTSLIRKSFVVLRVGTRIQAIKSKQQLIEIKALAKGKYWKFHHYSFLQL